MEARAGQGVLSCPVGRSDSLFRMPDPSSGHPTHSEEEDAYQAGKIFHVHCHTSVYTLRRYLAGITVTHTGTSVHTTLTPPRFGLLSKKWGDA